MRDLAVVALEEVLADDLPVRIELRLPARVEAKPSTSSPSSATCAGIEPSASRERLGISSRVHEHERAPRPDGRRAEPELVVGKSGSSSDRGARRSEPSRPYVHAWYGHCSVSRLPSPSATWKPRWRQTLTERAHLAVLRAGDDDRHAPDLRREEGPRLRELPEVADVLPRAAENRSCSRRSTSGSVYQL